MDNNAIAANFSLLGKLLDIHGENSFKARSYATAAFTIEKLPLPLSGMSIADIASVRGIGDAIAKKIEEQLETGKLSLLDEYIAATPPGVLEMIAIKGIGPKKINVIWKELGVESIGELLYACTENRLVRYKGFGDKTQANIAEAIRFYLAAQGQYLYQEIEYFALNTTEKLPSVFPGGNFLIAGHFRRQMETVSELEWATDVPLPRIADLFLANGYALVSDEIAAKGTLSVKGPENVLMRFHAPAPGENLVQKRFALSASDSFLAAWQGMAGPSAAPATEEALFQAAGIPFVPPFLRESPEILAKAREGRLPRPIESTDVRGFVHCHSNWSDGSESLETMVAAAIRQGFSYLLITDHSQSAFYANGLKPEQVIAQHEQIDELNARHPGFRIFKGIESDILNDGSLDYTDDILDRFDLIISSVHSNLKMNEEKAMLRLLRAIENPYTSILGHPTGRLLLSRNGYPIDHEKIIDACVANHVAIELNAHPRRLDIDWRWIDKALAKGALISIDPDAHELAGYADIRFGVLAAQKAGLEAKDNLSSRTLQEMESFIAAQRSKRP